MVAPPSSTKSTWTVIRTRLVAASIWNTICVPATLDAMRSWQYASIMPVPGGGNACTNAWEASRR